MAIKESDVDALRENENHAATLYRLRVYISTVCFEGEALLRSCILPRAIAVLSSVDNDVVHREGVRMLMNLAAVRDGAEWIQHHGGLEVIQRIFFNTRDEETQLHCIWAFGNIVMVSHHIRDHCVSLGVFRKINAVLNSLDEPRPDGTEKLRLATIKTSLWALSSFFINREFITISTSRMQQGLSMFVKYLEHPDPSIHNEAIRGFNYISSYHFSVTNLCERVKNPKIISTIVNFLHSKVNDKSMLLIILDTIGHLCYSLHDNVEDLCHCHFTDILTDMLDPYEDIRVIKKVFWVLSRCCELCDLPFALMASYGTFIKAICLMRYHQYFSLRRTAAYFVMKITRKECYVKNMLACDVLRDFTRLLKYTQDEDQLIELFNTFDTVLYYGRCTYGDGVNLYAILMDKYGTLKKIESLQIHSSRYIRHRARQLINKYFYEVGECNDLP